MAVLRLCKTRLKGQEGHDPTEVGDALPPRPRPSASISVEGFADPLIYFIMHYA